MSSDKPVFNLERLSERMLSRWYVLDDNGNPKRAASVEEYCEFFGMDFEKKVVRRDNIGDKADWDRLGSRIWASTVFLALDHNFGFASDEPVLWETMVFGLPDDEEIQERYTSRESAVEGHERIVREVKERYNL